MELIVRYGLCQNKKYGIKPEYKNREREQK